MITQTVNGLERIVRFRPAWHKVHKDPKKDYGVHGVELHMVLKGPEGAVHFLVSTGMMLKETYEWWDSRGGTQLPPRLMSMGIDVGYHSPKPTFEGHEVYWPTEMRKKDPNMPDPGVNATQEERLAYISNVEFVKIGDAPPKCEYIDGPCYPDGSALRAEDWFEVFKKEGDDKIWAMMEGEYKALFGSKK